MGCPQHLRGQVTDPDDSAGPGPALPRPFMKKLSLVGATVAPRASNGSRSHHFYTREQNKEARAIGAGFFVASNIRQSGRRYTSKLGHLRA